MAAHLRRREPMTDDIQRTANEKLMSDIEDCTSDDFLPTPYHDLPEFIRLAKERLDDAEKIGMPFEVAHRYKMAIRCALLMLGEITVSTLRKLEFAPVAVQVIRSVLPIIPANERVAFFDSIQEGYCVHCGEHAPKHGTCQCWNDE
jgi:hypothetical protein